MSMGGIGGSTIAAAEVCHLLFCWFSSFVPAKGWLRSGWDKRR